MPPGVLPRVPNTPKKRKFERGLLDNKTWVFAFAEHDDSGPYLLFHEGPI